MAFDRPIPATETAGAPAAQAVATAALEASLAHDGFAPTFTDFPQRLVRFREVSKMPWAAIARRLGAGPKTVRRWHKNGVRPNAHYLLTLQDLAEGRGLGHLFTVRATPYQTAESESREESGQGPADRTTGAKRTPGGLDIPKRDSGCPPEGSAMLCPDSAHTTASVKRP